MYHIVIKQNTEIFHNTYYATNPLTGEPFEQAGPCASPLHSRLFPRWRAVGDEGRIRQMHEVDLPAQLVEDLEHLLHTAAQIVVPNDEATGLDHTKRLAAVVLDIG